MNKNVYKRPEKPKIVITTRRIIEAEKEATLLVELPVIHATTECHVTPSGIANRMAVYLGHKRHILEPSAGTGNLIEAACADRKTAIESNIDLCCFIMDRTGINPICCDFLEYQPEELFDGIIMNPPFSKAKKHIEKAILCLEPKGVIVAILSLIHI